jgi:hypothetical protein
MRLATLQADAAVDLAEFDAVVAGPRPQLSERRKETST